jgi:hypothetical protein
MELIEALKILNSTEELHDSEKIIDRCDHCVKTVRVFNYHDYLLCSQCIIEIAEEKKKNIFMYIISTLNSLIIKASRPM